MKKKKSVQEKGEFTARAPFLSQQCKTVHFFQKKSLDLSLIDKVLKLIFHLQQVRLCSTGCNNCDCMYGDLQH